MRLLVAPGAVVLLGVLAGCSLGATQHTAATTTSKKASPSAAATYNPLSGPVEAASLLPKSCSKILSDADLATAFGAPQTGDDSYGSYAPLPNIGRTGRVTCGFGIGIDQFGNPSPAAVTVSLITYTTAAAAVSRVASDVSGNVAKGATAQPLLVIGHPATILVSAPPTAVQPSPSGAASTSPSANASPAASPSTAASPSASAAAPGETELLMADGNRTFVLEIPLTKLAGTGAVNALVSLAALVYQHTTPSAASASAVASASASAPASASPSASAN